MTPETLAFLLETRGNFRDSSGPAAVRPPSTRIASPVTNSESSLARKSAAPATWLPVPYAGQGWDLAKAALVRSRSSPSDPGRVPAESGVAINPGQIAFTLIRLGASSTAADFERLMTAAFAAE